VISDDPLALLTPADLAELWGTGEDWIRQGVAARRWKWTRAGREIRFTRDQAAAILADREVEAEQTQVPTRDEVAARRATAVAQPNRKESRMKKTGPDTGGPPSGPGTPQAPPQLAKAAAVA
jgi:hypothetical protein